MKAYVVDTQILWWHLTTDQRKLSRTVRRIFEQAERGEALLYVPVLVLVEIWDINHKLGHPLNFRHILQVLLQASQFVFVPLDVDDVIVYGELSAIPDSRDRIIAAVTRKIDAPLITTDRAIIKSGAVPVVEA
jgi:PIN domain nuclease of toxin-antitoxin system